MNELLHLISLQFFSAGAFRFSRGLSSILMFCCLVSGVVFIGVSGWWGGKVWGANYASNNIECAKSTIRCNSVFFFITFFCLHNYNRHVLILLFLVDPPPAPPFFRSDTQLFYYIPICLAVCSTCSPSYIIQHRAPSSSAIVEMEKNRKSPGMKNCNLIQ